MCALLLAPLSLPHHPICLAAEGEGAQLPACASPPPLFHRRRSSSLAGPAVLPSLSLSLHPRAPSPAPALQRRDPGPPRPRRHRARPDPRRRGPPPAPDPAPWRRSSVRAGGRPSLPRWPRTRGPAPAPAPALRRRSLPGGARGGPARARAPPRRWDLRPAAFTPHSGAPSKSGVRGRSWRRRAGGAGCRARAAARRPSRRQQARAASTHGGEGAPASAQSKHAGPTVPPSSLSLLRPPRARPPQARSGGSCRATRALGAATGGLAHADGGERRRSEWRPVNERTWRRRTVALGVAAGGRAHSEG